MTTHRKSPVDQSSTPPEMCGIDLRLRILSRVPFFAGLKPAQLQKINQHFVEKGYAAGETIYLSGDPAERLYLIADGKVKLLRHSPSGKRMLLELLAPGDPFGSLPSLGDDTQPDTAQAQTPACILSISAADFEGVLDSYPPVARQVLAITAGRLRAAHEMMRQLSLQPAEQRIAYTLLKLAQKLGEPSPEGVLIQTPLSREDLADMTGLTPETTSRVLSQLQKEGIIQSGRQWVAIADPGRLEEVATRDE